MHIFSHKAPRRISAKPVAWLFVAVFSVLPATAGAAPQKLVFASAEASLVQTNFGGWPPSLAIDGKLGSSDPSGWAVYGNPNEEAIFVLDQAFGAGSTQNLSIDLHQLYTNRQDPHLISAFELFYTTDVSPDLNSPRFTFATLSVASDAGRSFAIEDNVIALSDIVPGDQIATDVYRVSTTTGLLPEDITALVLTVASGTAAGNNTGNFVLTEIEAFAGANNDIPTPPILLLFVGGITAAAAWSGRRGRAPKPIL